jgi:predicted negative regulator of RcsB-dependent stress response
MKNEPTTAPTASPSLKAAQVYAMAVVCLMLGLAIGYLLRGTKSPVSPTQSAVSAEKASAPGGAVGGAMAGGQIPGPQDVKQTVHKPAQPAAGTGPPSAPRSAMAGGRMPSLEEMKQMADKQAAPLLEQLKSDPKNSAVLMQVGAIYYTTHRFKEASAYYGKAVQIEPGNAAFRVKLATSLYSSGDVNGAIAQLNQALSDAPNDANALFDLGMIRLQGKQDGKGAVAAWQQLLKTNPQLSTERRAAVEKLMADVLTTLNDQNAMRGAPGNDGHKSNSN